MKFSIITVCRNDENRIGKTLKSIYNQNYDDYENIVMDGCSTDDTMEIIKKSCRYYGKGSLKYYSKKDRGIYDAMNKGIALAQGEFICFLNAGDVFFDSDVLANIADSIQKYPGYDIYFGEAEVVYPNGRHMRVFEYSSDLTFIENIKKGSFMPCHQSIFAKKDCFHQNDFDLKYSVRAELNWYIKCGFSGKRIKGLPIFICKYSYGGASEKLANIKLSLRETRDIIKKFNLPCKNQNINFDEADRCMIIELYKWILLLHRGVSFEQFFKYHNIHKIAVYGYGVLGELLIEELHGTSINVAYIVDRNFKDKLLKNIPIFAPEDLLPEVDFIVITIVKGYEEVFLAMKEKLHGKVVLLDDILEQMLLI